MVIDEFSTEIEEDNPNEKETDGRKEDDKTKDDKTEFEHDLR